MILGCSADMVCGVGVELGEAVEGFADDLELAFDRRPEHEVFVEVALGSSLYKHADAVGGVLDVKEQGSCFRLHTAPRVA